MVTIHTIADKAGVSSSTVSRALQGSRLVEPNMRAHIESLARELGYRKRTIRRSAERAILNIRVILPRSNSPEQLLFYDFSELAEGLYEGLAPAAINLVCELHSPNYQPFPHKKGGDTDAFLFAFNQPSQPTIQNIRKAGIPHVILNRWIPGLPCLGVDHRKGYRDLIRHLLTTQSEVRPAFIALNGIEDIQNDRLDAMDLACKDFNIPFSRKTDVHRFNTPGDLRAPALLPLLPRYNAMVAVNDLMACLLLQELRSLNVTVPNQMAVTGFDNSPLRHTTRPLLTTISMPVRQLAREAARRLHAEILDKSPAAPSAQLAGELLVGATTIPISQPGSHHDS